MGRAEDVGHAEQRAVGARLRGVDVQGHAAEMAAAKPFGQGRFVVDAAAGAVDQPGALFQQGDFFRPNQVPRLLVQRGVHGEVIDQGEQLAGVGHCLDAHSLGPGGREEGVVGNHPHFHGQGPHRHSLADAAQADDSQGLAGQLGPHEFLSVPAMFGEALMGGGEVSRQAEHQRQGVFRGGNGVSAGGVHHDDALPRGRLGVDIVHADACPGDRPQTMVVLQGLGGDLHAAAADGPVGFQQGLSQVLAFQAGADEDFDVSGRLEQIEAVLGQVVEYDDRGHGGAPRGFLDPSSLTPRPISARAPVRQKEASTFPRSPELSRMRQPHFRETNEWGAQRSGLAGASKLVASAVSTLGSDWRRFQVFHLKSVRPKDDSELLARAGRRMRVHVTDAERASRNVRVVDARSVQEIICKSTASPALSSRWTAFSGGACCCVCSVVRKPDGCDGLIRPDLWLPGMT